MNRVSRRGTKTAGHLAMHVSAVAIMACAFGAGSAAFAQDDSPVLEEIQVTGSRIQQTGMNTPTPVTTLSVDELSNMAPGTLIESLSQLPQFYNNSSVNQANAFFNSPGSGSLNLRGLGTNRTLVLVNGRRMPSSSKEGAVDINVLPSEMIQRVETVTGGASAAYGTDAVSGVVNFILDTNYSGFTGHVQGGVSGRGDNENWEAGAAFGHDIGSRGHVLFSLEAAEAEGIFNFKGRDWYNATGLVTNPAYNADTNPNVPQRLTLPYVVSTQSSYDGIVSAPGTSIDRLAFNSDGVASPFIANDTAVIGRGTASQSIAGGGSGTDNNSDRFNLVPDSDRLSAYTYLDYDVTDNVNLYVQGIYGQNNLKQTNTGGLFQNAGAPNIYADNAFLPEAISQTMMNEGIEYFELNRIGHSLDLAHDAYTTMQNTTYAGTIGFDADITSNGFFDGWNTNGYYQHGKVKANNYQWGGIRLDRFTQAVDAVVDPDTGATVCRTTLFSDMYADCKPLNLFGRGNASQEALDWVTGMDEGEQITTNLYYGGEGLDTSRTDSYTAIDAKQYLATIKQDVAEWSASGEIWDGWGAGPVSAAFGVSYRKESIDQVVRDSTNPTANNETFHPVPGNDPALGIRGANPGDVGNTVGIQFSKVPNIRGSLNTKEAFGELLVPLLSDASILNQLNASLAARYADYSGSGGIWAWKAGLDADITGGFRLRGTMSRDVRAATLSERFNQTGGSGFINDPFNLDGSGIPLAYNIFLVSGGNPTVSPEKADTITIGAVYQPNWLDGFGLSVDWYQMKISDALGTIGTQAVVDRCFEGATDLCDLIEFNPNGTINVVRNVIINIDKAQVSGVDIEASYRSSVSILGGGNEMLNFRAFATYLDENSTTSPGAAPRDTAGQIYLWGTPHWKWNASVNYSNGGFGLFVQERYIGGGNVDNTWTTGMQIDDNHIKAAYYTDLRLSYTVDTGGGDVEIFGNVTNLFDKAPPIVPSYSNFTASVGQYNSVLHDVIGRRFVGGVRFRY